MKLNLTHNDLRAIVTETITRLGYRGLLNEISAEDAYARFYQETIPAEAYTILMNGAKQMTPLHKLAADHAVQLYGRGFKNKAMKLIKMVSDFWANANNESRQYAVKLCKDEADTVKKSPDIFINLMNQLIGMKSHSENSYVERGFEVLFEDDKLRITCTKSYSSSCRHYGESHWCTASDQFGDYDGFDMFKRYTIESNSALFQFYIKENPERSCQAEINQRGTLRQMCNWNDYTISRRDLDSVLKTYDGVAFSVVFDEYIAPNLTRLCAETAEIVKDENVYYTKKKEERLRTIKKSVETAMKSNECASVAKLVFDGKGNDARKTGVWNGWKTETDGMIFISVNYLGKTQAEKDFFDYYFNDTIDSYDEYGPIITNMVFAFDRSGNIDNKYNGYISVSAKKFVIITDVYDDELSYGKVLFVVDANTATPILKNVEAINTYDCEDYMSSVCDELPVRTYNRLFRGKDMDAFWYVFIDEKEKAYALCRSDGSLVKVPNLNW